MRPAIQRLADYKSAIRQIANLRYGPTGHRAFSLIEFIGVLAIMAILAAALAPNLVRQMDHTAGDQESAALKSFGDALQKSITRNRSIPAATDWATIVATELGVDTTAVTASPRRQPRFFLIDPDLNINNTGVTPGGNGAPALPYTQNNAGSPNQPALPRVLILSSIGRALPGGIVSGVPTAADFTGIWNSADRTVPAAPVFAGWAGVGDDLKVQRVDLSPLFVELQLSRLVSACCPRYSIDTDNWTTAISVPDATPDWPGYFIQNSILYLYNHGGELDSEQILIRNNAFVYDQNKWRSNIGGEGFLGGLDIASVVTRYLAAYPNVQAENGVNQQSIVVQSMMDYMDRYSEWAAAGFPYNFGTAPLYIEVSNAQLTMKNAVQGQYLANGYDPNEVPCQ